MKLFLIEQEKTWDQALIVANSASEAREILQREAEAENVPLDWQFIPMDNWKISELDLNTRPRVLTVLDSGHLWVEK